MSQQKFGKLSQKDVEHASAMMTNNTTGITPIKT